MTSCMDPLDATTIILGRDAIARIDHDLVSRQQYRASWHWFIYLVFSNFGAFFVAYADWRYPPNSALWFLPIKPFPFFRAPLAIAAITVLLPFFERPFPGDGYTLSWRTGFEYGLFVYPVLCALFAFPDVSFTRYSTWRHVVFLAISGGLTSVAAFWLADLKIRIALHEHLQSQTQRRGV